MFSLQPAVPPARLHSLPLVENQVRSATRSTRRARPQPLPSCLRQGRLAGFLAVLRPHGVTAPCYGRVVHALFLSEKNYIVL